VFAGFGSLDVIAMLAILSVIHKFVGEPSVVEGANPESGKEAS
jgi:hypothetical protein